MSYSLKLSEAEKLELQNSQKNVSSIKLYKRIQCILMVDTGISRTKIAKIFDVSSNTITTWVKCYKSGGLSLLLKLDYEGRRVSKLDALKSEINQYVINETPSTIANVQDWLKKEHNVSVEHSWLYRYFKKNSIYLIKKQD